ncbi:hypothetical protein V6N12_001295 [Hibiscus sabdariffa]|uniref:Reverse transcriptase zinc-binding domain-containing protein n=1 Tax=Hibiscus sabdariffa TaxID=183260 RepID=A0ABR2C6U2_9ROSI
MISKSKITDRVASQGKVVATKSSLNAEKNTAIQVLDSSFTSTSRAVKGRVLPSSLRGGISKPVTKKSGSAPISKNGGSKQKKRDAHTSSTPTLAVGLSNLIEDLTNAEELETSRLGESSSKGVGEGDKTDTRHFTTSSAYSYLSDIGSTTTDTIWKKAWALPIPQRVKTFMWITLHGRHLTNAERFRRHLTSSVVCDICGFHMEDMSHILRNCVEARGVWTRRTSHSLSGNGLVDSIRYWIDHNWELVIRHIPRTCNILADKLATWGRLNAHEVMNLASPPSSMVADVETGKSSLQTDPLMMQDWFGHADVVCFNPRVDPGG